MASAFRSQPFLNGETAPVVFLCLLQIAAISSHTSKVDEALRDYEAVRGEFFPDCERLAEQFIRLRQVTTPGGNGTQAIQGFCNVEAGGCNFLLNPQGLLLVLFRLGKISKITADDTKVVEIPGDKAAARSRLLQDGQRLLIVILRPSQVTAGESNTT